MSSLFSPGRALWSELQAACVGRGSEFAFLEILPLRSKSTHSPLTLTVAAVISSKNAVCSVMTVHGTGPFLTLHSEWIYS